MKFGVVEVWGGEAGGWGVWGIVEAGGVLLALAFDEERGALEHVAGGDVCEDEVVGDLALVGVQLGAGEVEAVLLLAFEEFAG